MVYLIAALFILAELYNQRLKLKFIDVEFLVVIGILRKSRNFIWYFYDSSKIALSVFICAFVILGPFIISGTMLYFLILIANP